MVQQFDLYEQRTVGNAGMKVELSQETHKQRKNGSSSGKKVGVSVLVTININVFKPAPPLPDE